MTGFGHFWSQGDFITRSVAALLLLMSVSAWVVIFWKAWLLRRVRVDLSRAVPAFWAAPSLDAGRELKDCAVTGRSGLTGERDPSAIGFSAIRGGDIVGDHTVLFAGTGERIEISHRSASRATYAQGSLRAVRFLAERQNGLHDMFDVLGLKDQ